MSQVTYLVRKGGDADLNNVTVAGTLTVTGATAYGDTALDDAVAFGFGKGDETDQDVEIQWDGTNLIVAALADDELIEIGDAAATQMSFDIKWTANEANGASYLYSDASANLIYTTGVDLQFKDNDVLVFGTGAGATGDVGITYDANSLNVLPVGATDALELGATGHLLNTTLKGTLTVGVDATGYDVQFFGDTTGCSLLWDQSEDQLTLVGDLSVTGTTTFTGDTTVVGDFTVGVDATGHDVTFFGDTTGCKMVWDQSEDQLVITGPADVPALKIAGAGSKSAAGWAAAGAAWADSGVTPAFVEDQMFLLVDVGGTVYRIPLWANA